MTGTVTPMTIRSFAREAQRRAVAEQVRVRDQVGKVDVGDAPSQNRPMFMKMN